MSDNIPFISVDQMIEVDRLMIEEYGIELIQMMENAGLNLARLATKRFLDGNPNRKKVAILAGSGGNGGGAMAAGRRLNTWGADISVFLTRSIAEIEGVPGQQLGILDNMKISVFDEGLPDGNFDLIIDGLIGYSLSGVPRGRAAELINWANQSVTPTLSLDIPSGLAGTSGIPFDPAIKAAATMTLALPKVGLKGGLARPYVGDLYLADISVPPGLYTYLGIEPERARLFGQQPVIRVRM